MLDHGARHEQCKATATLEPGRLPDGAPSGAPSGGGACAAECAHLPACIQMAPSLEGALLAPRLSSACKCPGGPLIIHLQHINRDTLAAQTVRGHVEGCELRARACGMKRANELDRGEADAAASKRFKPTLAGARLAPGGPAIRGPFALTALHGLTFLRGARMLRGLRCMADSCCSQQHGR